MTTTEPDLFRADDTTEPERMSFHNTKVLFGLALAAWAVVWALWSAFR